MKSAFKERQLTGSFAFVSAERFFLSVLHLWSGNSLQNFKHDYRFAAKKSFLLAYTVIL